jgi:hypothetical protein
VRPQRIVGPPVAAVEWLAALPGEVRAVYEAGPTEGDRVKTDARDALKLARLHAAGQLRPVVVPTLELEGAATDWMRCCSSRPRTGIRPR